MTIHPPRPDDPPTFGRYRVIGALESAAGFRSVLAAGPDDGLVVVQQAQPELLDEPDFRIRMRHSAVAAMRVSGATNTTVIDVDADAEKPWLASVFVPGVRLDAAVAAHGPLPVPAVRALAGALATALREVHATGLVHQRLRADTILLTRDSGRLGEIGISRASTPAATGTATAIGNPDFLSPEQALGHPLTPASDVFSLGAVLAFAASGVAPFAAPSVPYTLFNIAQREPDLSRVPEPLFEMLAACLRKDPAARPTPGQILDYLGAQPTGAAPWPAPVLDDIGRLQHEISALLAASPAGVDPEPIPARSFAEVVAARGTACAEFARGVIESARSGWSVATPRRRVGTAGGLVVLLLALSGITYFATGTNNDSGPVTGLTIAELRRIDACPWLASAIGDSVPVAPVALPADRWELEPSTTWGCRAEADDYTIALSLGQENKYLTPHRTVVDGVPIIFGTTVSCLRAIASPGAEQAAGIAIELRLPYSMKDENCAGVDYLAANIARSLTTAPRAENRESSLAALDPCTLLDRDTVAAEIGILPPEPTIADAHTCQWDARLQLSLKLARTSLYTSDPKVADTIVDGVEMYTDSISSRSKCTRAYRTPQSEESVEVEVQGADGFRNDYCALAEDFLHRAVRKLPDR
ncbi:serine/threonine protein kinase [Nocardia halotolerans]|uniref:non-specific serine/threonine protein kinase n=1 Tax=Nocardia halotolerans TaxID=1755878 RepID=A0ABV8VLT3_9NOCA